MNGAVQGLATITASTPVKKCPAVPPRRTRPPPRLPRRTPKLTTPDIDRPTANNTQASTATITGCCNWVPQPTTCPAPRRPRIARPIARNVAMTPVPYASAWRRDSARLVLLSSTPTALTASIGSTHGIRFRIRPPAKASSSANGSPMESGPASDVASFDFWPTDGGCGVAGAVPSEAVIALPAGPPPGPAPIGPPPLVGNGKVSAFGG